MVDAEQMTESSEQSSKKDDQNETEPWLDDIATEDLPCSLIVTNLDNCIFSCLEEKAKFEEIFKVIENDVSFQYFKSFKRARVNYASPLSAAKARIECHQRKFGESFINCYFAQVIENDNDKNASQFNHLLPPSPVRQFLISPPASPPVGWEPREEGEPIINYDLITALTKLTPGCTHELHPPTDAQPAIVVHVCGDEVEEQSEGSMAKTKIQQTRRPPARSLSEGSEDSSDSLAA